MSELRLTEPEIIQEYQKWVEDKRLHGESKTWRQWEADAATAKAVKWCYQSLIKRAGELPFASGVVVGVAASVMMDAARAEGVGVKDGD